MKVVGNFLDKIKELYSLMLPIKGESFNCLISTAVNHKYNDSLKLFETELAHIVGWSNWNSCSWYEYEPFIDKNDDTYKWHMDQTLNYSMEMICVSYPNPTQFAIGPSIPNNQVDDYINSRLGLDFQVFEPKLGDIIHMTEQDPHRSHPNSMCKNRMLLRIARFK